MLQNLLQKEYKKNIETEYYMRLTTVASLILVCVIVIGVFALVPAYVHVIEELKVSRGIHEEQQKNNEDTKILTDELSHGLVMLTLLEENSSQNKLTTLLNEFFKERPDGIVISGFSYSRDNALLSVQGIARTRDLVVPFAQAIETNQYFEKAPVPISDLAKNTNLDFRLSITLSGQEKK